MLNSLRSLITDYINRCKSDTLTRNITITFTETVITKGLSFFIILILARVLGPTEYGKYSFIFVTVALLSAIFDFGMENTAVRFASRCKQDKVRVFGFYLSTKLLLLTLLIFALTLGAGFLMSIMGKPEVTPYIPFLIIGLVGESLFLLNDTYLQAGKRFILRALINISRYSLALLYVIMLLKSHELVLGNVLYIYLIPLAFCLLFLPRYIQFLTSLSKEKAPPDLVREVVRYEKWMLVYSIANNLLGRVDLMLLAIWVSFDKIGIYNAAIQLCAVVSFLPLVIGKALLPALCELEPEAILAKSSRIIKGLCILGALALCVIPVAPYIIPFILGDSYTASIPVLQILMMGFICSLIATPYEQALYSIGRPRLMSIGKYAQLGLIVLLGVATIPVYGILAAAASALVGKTFYLCYVRIAYGWAEREIRQVPPRIWFEMEAVK